MRIAQITLDVYDNYGNMLQKYALHKILKRLSDFTEVLWLKDSNFFHDIGAWMSHHPKRSSYGDINYQRSYFYEAVKTFKFKEFENRYIRTRFDIPYIEDIADEYDFFVVGSDQVWNPHFAFGEFPGMFLELIPRAKKISYAASIAITTIPPQYIEPLRRGISGFNNISVREESSIKLIKELTGQDALHVVDPTMLLTPEEWLEIAQKPSWFNEKYERGYILTYYFLDNRPAVIKNIAQALNLPIINLFDLDNYWHYVTSPEEFVWLFANATLIFTHSFHGTIFSILFKRPFMEIEIPGQTNIQTRIPSLLKMFRLENRIPNSEKTYTIDSILNIDYSTRDKILQIERNKAFKFLLDALNLNNGGDKI